MITVNPNYRILTGATSYTPQYTDTPEAEKKNWQYIGTFDTIENALAGIVQYETRRRLCDDAYDLETALSVYATVKMEILPDD